MGKNPLKIAFGNGIFACKPMFSYGQRSECADLLNSYKMPTHVHQQLLLSIIPQIIEKIYSESIDIPIFFSIIELALCLLKLNFEVHFTFI